MDYQYNLLNLLSEVKQGSISKAKYVYAADGTKLAVFDAGGNGYDYRGSFVYKRVSNALVLESAAFGDGRIIKTNSTYVPNYFITDHLGSVRLIFDASGIVKEENDYYAFGGKHVNPLLFNSENRFKFNGKELQTTGDIGFLDYGARMYDAKLGRWHNQDPAEQFVSPYNFCGNNSILFVDPNGNFADWYQNDFGTTFWANSQDPTHTFRGDIFNNIGNSLSMWDSNLGVYLNYYQNIFLGTSSRLFNIDLYAILNKKTLGSLLNISSALDVKYQQELMELSIHQAKIKFMENSLRACFGGEYAGPVLTTAGIVLSFTPYAPLATFVTGLGQTLSYGNAAITAYDYNKQGNTGAAIYTVGTTMLFTGSNTLFKFASKGSSPYVDNGLQFSNMIMEKIVGYGSKTIENNKKE